MQIAALSPDETAQLQRLFESYTRSEMLAQQVEEFRAGCAEQLAELQVRGGAGGGSARQWCHASREHATLTTGLPPAPPSTAAAQARLAALEAADARDR